MHGCTDVRTEGAPRGDGSHLWVSYGGMVERRDPLGWRTGSECHLLIYGAVSVPLVRSVMSGRWHFCRGAAMLVVDLARVLCRVNVWY